MFRLNHTFAHTALFKNKVLLIMLFLAGLSLSLFTLISGAVYAQGLENDPSSEDDSSDEVVITIKVDGFDESIPSLSSKNQDFVIGQPVKANPIYYQDENGETPLADLVESKEAEGYQLFWHDESGAVFDWFSTPVTKSQTITGSFVEGLNQVRIVFGDDKNTPDLIVEVSSGKSFSDAYENTLPTPVKAGYTFSEWINSKTNEPFDFDAPISSSTTVIATYKLTDATQTSTIDPTQDIPKTLTGTCYIGATWSVHPALFNVSNFSGGLKGCAGVGTCSLPSAAAPSYTTATYTATLKSVDVKAGKIVYSCHIVPPGAARPGGPSNSLGLIGYQTVAMECVVEKSFGGYVDIKKVSANPSLSNNNDRYSLENACFEIYNEKNQAVATLYTNEQGKTDKSPLLPSGTYTIVETQAPDGYARAESKTVTINPGETKTVTFEDYPLNNVVDLAVEKLDKELQTNTPLGNASLAGAEFTLSYYDRYLYSETDVNSAGSPERVWTIKTDEEGKAYLDEDHLVTGSPFYRDSQGTITLPLGTLVIKETKASPGYLCSDEVFIQHITTPVTPVLNSLSSSIGSLFSSKTNSSDEHITVFTPITCNEQVIRGDIAFSKIADSDATRLSTIPFRITSLTTGESHIVLTDENGMANTDNAWNKHSHNTNKGETCRDGIWFGQDKNNQFTAQVSNELGALPYDSYLVEELPCDANQQFNLISFTVTITRDGLTLDLGTIDNQEKPQVIIHKIDSTQENSEENLAGASLVLEIKEQSNTDSDKEAIDQETSRQDTVDQEVAEQNMSEEESTEQENTEQNTEESDSTSDETLWAEITQTVTTDEPWRLYCDTGIYQIRETEAPEGYEVSEPVKFQVLEGVDVTHVFVVDEPTTPQTPEIPEEPTTPEEDNPLPLPKTGDLPFIFGLILLLVGGLSVAFILWRRTQELKSKQQHARKILKNYMLK